MLSHSCVGINLLHKTKLLNNVLCSGEKTMRNSGNGKRIQIKWRQR